MANARMYGLWKLYATFGDYPPSSIGALIPYGSAFMFYT